MKMLGLQDRPFISISRHTVRVALKIGSPNVMVMSKLLFIFSKDYKSGKHMQGLIEKKFIDAAE